MNKIIICIGRQLGSGGHDIGRMLALDFQAKYYDREILNLAAKESGFSERFFEQNDERKGFLRSLFNIQTPHLGGDGSIYRSSNTQDNLFQFQSEAMKKAAAQESCVFVGRCADYILRDQPNLVTVFITAPLEFRIRQVMNKEGITETMALKKIQQGEDQRANYYNYYTGKKWGHATGYDLCIDSSILGLTTTEKFIADFIRKRFNL
ncbi:MAG: cytidylate kinase-like family protein [Prevotella sp.]|jgi:cytidylate kinase|nr:cytidylate kinase-like family protein [Prevotella sp.]